MSQVWQRTAQKPTELKPFEGNSYPLTDEDLEFFKSRYEIELLKYGTSIQRSDYRYLLPIWSPTGLRRGVVSREGWAGSPIAGWQYNNLPKALTYPERLEPLQSWYRASVTGLYGALVIVEDQLSAIKLFGRGYNSVALLGVPGDGNIGADRVRELATESRNDQVIIALDADATDKAFEFARKWGMAFRKLRVAILERDIKDTPAKEIPEALAL